MWRIRSTNSGNPKFLGVWEFKYDHAGRVTDFISYSIDSSKPGGPDTVDVEHTAFYYRGTDTLPYKSAALESATGVGTTTYHFFDNQGRKVLDSNESKNTGSMYYWDKVSYNYFTNNIVVTENGKRPLVGPRYYSDTIYISAQNNMSSMVHREEWPGDAPFTFYTYNAQGYPVKSVEMSYTTRGDLQGTSISNYDYK